MPGSVLAEGDAPAMARPRKYSDELRESAVRFLSSSSRIVRSRMSRRTWGSTRRGCGSGCARLRLIVASGAICGRTSKPSYNPIRLHSTLDYRSPAD